MESKIMKVLKTYTEGASRPLDDMISELKLNTDFRDLYTAYMAKEGREDLILQTEADPLEKDKKKALCFYTKCLGAVDLINEVLLGTEDRIAELLVFFVRLLDGLKSCEETMYGPGYFKIPDNLVKYLNLSSGQCFSLSTFLTCFRSLEDCKKYTRCDEKSVYFKIENSFKRKDVSMYLADIAGVVPPGASLKLVSSHEESGTPVVTISFEGNSNRIYKAYSESATLPTSMVPDMLLADKPFAPSNTKVSDLETHYRTLSLSYQSLFESLLETKFSGEAEPEKNKAATKDLMDRCTETIKYLNNRGVLKGYGLTEEEARAITIFTFDYGAENMDKNPQRIINQTLAKRNTNGMMAIRMYILHLLSALRKLPQYKGTELYRGINGENISSSYVIGETRTWPAFTSAYPDEDSALDFLSGENKILFEIHGDFCGYNIQDFSIFHEEGKKENI